jgi:hypothetical protein
MKYKTEMTLPVELTFEILEPLEVDGTELPAQLDITKILLTITGPGGKPRQVDITKTMTEEQMFLLEDEIVEHFTNENP